MTITKNGSSDTYEFELPANYADELVTAVSIADGTITIIDTYVDDYREQAGRAAGAGEKTFKIGDLYDGNLGELVGRTVNIGLNSDNEVETFSVNDAEVVYAAVKAIDGDGKDTTLFGLSSKDYLQAADKTKYYWSVEANQSSSVTATYAFGFDGDWNWPVKDEKFDYAKLVLNPDGTISYAQLGDWEGLIVATSAEDGVATETKNNTKDFSKFTVVKDGLYIDADDLEAGDVIYFNDTDSFSEVYRNDVIGSLDAVYTDSAKVDGTEYKWDNLGEDYETTARYYDDDNDKYVDVTEKWLLAADTTEDVTFTLDRWNNAVLIETVQGEEVTTTHDYIITKAPIAYLNGVDQMMNIGVSDGTATTLKIALADLKYLEGGDKTTWTAKNTADDSPVNEKTEAADADGDLLFYLSSDDEDPVDATTYAVDTLLTVTYNEDGDVIGLKTNAITDNMSTDPEKKAALKPGLTQLVTEGGKVALSDDTNIYIITGKKTNNSDMKVTKVAYEDYNKTTQTGSAVIATGADKADAPSAGEYVSVYATNTKATNIVIDASAQTGADLAPAEDWEIAQNAVFADSDVAESVVGVVKSVKTGLDSDKENTELKEITILNGTYPKGVTFDEIAANTTAPAKNAIVTIDLDADGAVLDVTTVGEGADVGEYVQGTRSNINSTEYVTVGTQTVRPTDTAFVAFFDGSNYTTTTVGAINRETTKYGTIMYYVSEQNDTNDAAEIIIAKGDGEPKPAVLGTAVFTFNKLTPTTKTSDNGCANYTGALVDGAKIGLQAYNGTSWDLVGGEPQAAGSPVKTATNANITANTYYRLVVSAEGYDPAFVYMDGDKTDAAVIASVTAANPIPLANLTTPATGTTTLAFKDQFDDAIALSDLTITNVAMSSGKNTIKKAGKGTWTITSPTISPAGGLTVTSDLTDDSTETANTSAELTFAATVAEGEAQAIKLVIDAEGAVTGTIS